MPSNRKLWEVTVTCFGGGKITWPVVASDEREACQVAHVLMRRYEQSQRVRSVLAVEVRDGEN